uniref:Uncharacterized protein n=1 Tax=Cacopsylla melanoneura TaxID=428564 RepID=A0A8D8TII5_9HEMI
MKGREQWKQQIGNIQAWNGTWGKTTHAHHGIWENGTYKPYDTEPNKENVNTGRLENEKYNYVNRNIKSTENICSQCKTNNKTYDLHFPNFHMKHKSFHPI